MGRQRIPAIAWALLALPVGFWGGGYTATAVATEHTSGLMLAGLRCLPTLAVMPLAVLLGARLPRGANLRGAAISGVLVVTVFFIGLSEGTSHAGAANAAVLISAAPLWVALLARVFLHERIAPTATAGLGLGFAGIVLMVSRQLGGTHGAGDLALGIGLALAAGIAWAAGTMVIRRLAVRDPKLDFVGLTAVQYLVGSPILVVVAFALKGTGGTQWGSIDLWGATLWLAIGSSAIATVAFFMSLRWLDAAKASSSQFLVPVVAVVVELVRGHAPGGLVLVGMTLAILGVALVVAGESARGAVRRRRTSPAAATGSPPPTR